MQRAFVFPGQGSQSIGMLAPLAAEFPEVEATFASASTILGRDLWSMVQQGSAETLNQTESTQPAMLCADVACWRVWQRLGGADPVFMAGHSLGEYAALVCAGAIRFEDSLRLVVVRARLMQEAVPRGAGAMVAVLGLDDESVARVCREAAEGEIVEPVNYNAPGQVVIAGDATAVERAAARAKAAGAKRVMTLPVSVPSHCSLMNGAAGRLAEALRDVVIARPQIPVVHNAHVREEPGADGIRSALARQLCLPVQWVATIRHMTAGGVHRLTECGPGKVLAGLNKRIEPEVETETIADPVIMRAAVAE